MIEDYGGNYLELLDRVQKAECHELCRRSGYGQAHVGTWTIEESEPKGEHVILSTNNLILLSKCRVKDYKLSFRLLVLVPNSRA